MGSEYVLLCWISKVASTHSLYRNANASSQILQNGLVRSIEGPVQERERSPTLEVEPAAPGNSPNVRRLGRLRNGGRA